jgi:hypothetical protein
MRENNRREPRRARTEVTDGENDERRVDRVKTMLIRECCLNFQSAFGSD